MKLLSLPIIEYVVRTFRCNEAIKTVTILGSENCQSISFQNLLSASQLVRLCDLTLSTETVRQRQSFCQITAFPYPAIHIIMARKTYRVTPVRENVCQSCIITACHDDWLTGVWNSLCRAVDNEQRHMDV